MDKRNLLAVILSVLVISAGFMIQNRFFPSPAVETVRETSGTDVSSSDVPRARGESTSIAQERTSTDSFSQGKITPTSMNIPERTITEETDVFIVTFSNRGGVVTSLKLKEHKDGQDYVDMVNSGNSGEGAFAIRFGGVDSPEIDETFEYKRIDQYTFEFSRVFLAPARPGEDLIPFLLKKTYFFMPDEYMIELQITIENSVKDFPNLNLSGFSYTLSYGPQIGPVFSQLDGRREYRKYYTLVNEKQKNVKVGKAALTTVTDRVTWAGIVGKYFSVIAIPDATPYQINYSTLPIEGAPETSIIHFSRPPIKSSKNTDVFRFYAGPKRPRELARYDSSDRNGFGLSGYNLEAALDSSTLLGWLENLLKAVLLFFYKLIPNYGVAIILLTIFIKVISFPINHKGSQSTAKMKALGPKLNELKEKHKSNPQKLNAEMAALYKKEGVNPMGGCLPLLIQFPIFIALYGLLNKHFELRGAVFLSGWITDLSQPESIFNFAPFKIPILGWSDIRLLPFIYIGTQLLSSKIMQTDASANPSMKMMTYMMPIVFFFILYDMPSGLIIYWTITNLITVLQQLYSNRKLEKAGGDNGPKDKGGKGKK